MADWADWLEAQLVDPDRTANLVVESQLALSDHVKLKKLGSGWNYNVVFDVRPRFGTSELSENCVQAVRRLSVGNWKLDSLASGHTRS